LCCLEACWCYVAGLVVGDVVSECRLNHYSSGSACVCECGVCVCGVCVCVVCVCVVCVCVLNASQNNETGVYAKFQRSPVGVVISVRPSVRPSVRFHESTRFLSHRLRQILTS